MNWLFALLVTAGLYGLMMALGIFWSVIMHLAGLPQEAIQLQAKAMGFVFTLGCSIWLYFDAKKIGFNNYKGFMSGSPATVAVCCALMWLIVFPGYLQKRWQITHGNATMKSEAEISAAAGRPNWVLMALGGIIIIIVGITVYTIISANNFAAQMKKVEDKAMAWPSTTANVVSVEKISSTGSKLQYEYTVDTKKYSRNETVFLGGKSFAVGRQIKVHYDPAKPSQAMVLHDSE